MRRSVLAVGLSLAIGTQYAAESQTAPPFGGAGLVAYWSFDRVSGNVVTDLAGGDNDGRLHGSPPAVLIAGPFGSQAIAFVDAGQKITGPDRGFPSGSSPGSISLWFNRPPGVSNKVLFSYGARSRGRARGLWLVREDRLCFYFWGHPKDLHVDL